MPLADILPVRQIKDPQSNIKRYRTIRASIKEVGMIEPLVVYPQKGAPGKYLLLDGHLRSLRLKDLGETEADCIIASDDECFTYNARVNRLNPIAEHKMIMKAVQQRGEAGADRGGAEPDRVSDVKASMSLLDGINEEAVDLLKDKAISPKAIRLLRKVTGVRQIEIAELMVSANNFTKGYAEALVLGTPKDQLVNPEEPKQKKGMTREEIAKLEAEMESLERDLKAVEELRREHAEPDLARGYIKRLLDNAKVVRFLNGNYRDILTEFETMAAAEGV